MKDDGRKGPEWAKRWQDKHPVGKVSIRRYISSFFVKNRHPDISHTIPKEEWQSLKKKASFEHGIVDGMTKVALSVGLMERARDKALDKAMAVDLAKATPQQAAYATKKVDQAMKFNDGVFKKTMDQLSGKKPVSVPPKPSPKMPTKMLGLGAAGIGVMGLGAMALHRRQQKLQQPPKPQRY